MLSSVVLAERVVALFILVHELIGLVHLSVQIHFLLPGNSYSDADIMFFRSAAHTLYGVKKSLLVSFPVDDKKFIPSESEGSSRELPFDAVCRAANEGVTSLVAVFVVDEFQSVDVKDGQPQ